MSLTINPTIFDHCLFKLPPELVPSWRSLGTIVELMSLKCCQSSFIISIEDWTTILSDSLSITPLLAKSMFYSFAEVSDSLITQTTAALPPLALLLSIQPFYRSGNILSARAMGAEAWPSREARTSPIETITADAITPSNLDTYRHSFITSNLTSMLSLVFRVFAACEITPTAALIADSIDVLFEENPITINNIVQNVTLKSDPQAVADVILGQISSSVKQCQIFSDLSKKALILKQKDLKRCNISIFNCRRLFIVIMGHIDSIVISNCEQCTVFVGAVRHATITSSIKSSLSMTCRLIRVDNSSEIVSNVHCYLYPVVSMNCHRLIFGPFNSFYPSLLIDMSSISLSPILNKDYWKEPLGDVSSFKLEPPDTHIPFVVPFSDTDVEEFKNSSIDTSLLSGDLKSADVQNLLCTTCPVPLPSSFASDIKSRAELFQSIRAMTLDLKGDEKGKVERAVHSVFSEWLTSTGRARIIHDLVAAELEE
ncbi:hypothetical protein P9112_014412 [Eukaryota sp. TZLM1-RC]